MQNNNRRKDKRYNARWKVALVYQPTGARPVFHTLTHDLSISGTSVQNATDEKRDTVLNALLIPPKIGGVEQKIIRLKAIVMSSRPFRNGFRLGLSFVQDAELERLRGVLNGLDLSGDVLPSEPEDEPKTPSAPLAASTPQTAAPAAAPAASAAAPLGSSSVLEALKMRALSKKAEEEQGAASKEQREKILFKKISDTLMGAYKFLTEVVENMNQLKPQYAGTYTALGLPEFKNLSWQEDSRTNCLSRPSISGDKVFNVVTLAYNLVNPTPLKITQDMIAADKTEKALREFSLTFRDEKNRDAQGKMSTRTFHVTQEIKVRLKFTCDDETGKLFLEATHFEQLGTRKFELELDALNQALLDQIVLAMMGERSTASRMMKRVL